MMIGVDVFRTGHAPRPLTGSVLAAAILLAGCGSSERTLKLRAVKASVQAAGLHDLRILTQEGARQEWRRIGTPLHAAPTADGPDLLQSRREPALLVVRFGKKAEAVHAVSRYEQERTPRPVGFARTCNVVVINYTPGSAAERSRAVRIRHELRKRCS